MLKVPDFDIDEFKAKLGTRPVYFWGARHDGYGMCRIFQNYGFNVQGFIDSSLSLRGQTALGFAIVLPTEFFPVTTQGQQRPYIIITSAFFSDEVACLCREHGLKDTEDFLPFTTIQCFDYQIDVSGACNLKCISCPRGNMNPQPKAGFMDADVYRQVLQKIRREDPFTGIITLYNWGEPLIHPDLPKILNITHENGFLSAVSSNLCVDKDFTEVIQSRPTWFRVSVSGWGENFEITHTGGKWETFYSNLHKLRTLMDAYHPDMIVEVFYHIYRHNVHEDFPKIKQLCDSLGFNLRYRLAALAPLDNIEAIIEGRPVSEAVEKTRKLQYLSVEKAMELAREQKSRPCYYERFLWVGWDLRVAQCMEWFAPELSLVQGGFLNATLEELVNARNQNSFCDKCREKAIHRCFAVYSDEKLIPELTGMDL